MTKLRIRPFDIGGMKDDAVVLLIGKRGTGKSTMLKDIMYHMRDKLDAGVVMCPTVDPTEMEDGYQSFIPRTFIIPEFRAQVIARMLKSQQKYIKKHGKDGARRLFVIMDDCMYDKGAMKSKEVRRVAMNGRHKKIFFINAIQYMMDIGPDLRTNVDYVFALKENIIANREKLWKNFFGMFERYRDFSATMDALTSDYGAMVLDNRVNSTTMEDCVFWYNAKPAESSKFRLCRPVYWRMDQRFFRDADEEDADGDAGRDASNYADIRSSRRRRDARSSVSDIVDASRVGGKPRLVVERIKVDNINSAAAAAAAAARG